MVAFEVLVGLLVTGLALVTVFSAIAGLLGILGVVSFDHLWRAGPEKPCLQATLAPVSLPRPVTRRVVR